MEKLFLVSLLFIGFGTGFLFQNYTYESARREWQLYLKSSPLVKQLVTSSSMEHIVVIASKQYDVPLGEIATDYPVTLRFETIDSFRQTIRDIMKDVLVEQTVTSYWKRLNFIVVTTRDEIEFILEKVQQLDVEVGKKCLLRHFSRWILISTDERVPISSFKDNLFDNVNVISEHESSLNNTLSETEITLQTLMWEHDERALRDHMEFTRTGKSPFPNVNYGLNGRRITAAMLEWLPFSKKETGEAVNGTLMYTGITGEIMNRLAIIFNFSIQYVEPADQQWGEDINSSWTGIVGMLQREEVDMCGVPYAVNIDRQRVMTYSYPFLYKHQSAVYRKSVDNGHSWTVLISCFKWEVYMWGLVTLFLVWILFNVFEILNRFWFETTSSLTYTEVAMLTFSVPLHQGAHSIPSSASSKILLSFWWIFCIVLTGVYTGNLIALLTVSRESIPFRTIEELAEQNTHQIGTTSGEFIELIIKTSNTSVFQSLWDKAKLSKVPSSVTTEEEWQIHMDRLNSGQYILLLDETKSDMIMRESCDIAKIPDDFMPIYSSFTFPKDSPLAYLFADELMYMTENGLMSTWFKMWSPKAKICVEKSQLQNMQLTAGDLISGFLASAVGICLATISLIAEVIVYALYHNKKQSR